MGNKIIRYQNSVSRGKLRVSLLHYATKTGTTYPCLKGVALLQPTAGMHSAPDLPIAREAQPACPVTGDPRSTGPASDTPPMLHPNQDPACQGCPGPQFPSSEHARPHKSRQAGSQHPRSSHLQARPGPPARQPAIHARPDPSETGFPAGIHAALT